MYELEYVKKRKRRKVAGLVGVISTIGVGSLITVSFLGRFVGTFTVSLDDDGVKLSLDEHKTFPDPVTFLRINQLAPFEEMTYGALPTDAELDTEETSYLYGANYAPDGELESLNFFKYTFYVKNVGDKTAQYRMRVNITDRNESTDGTARTLDDTLRVMVYENDGNEDGSHSYKIFAKEAAEYNYTKDGEKTRQEFVSAYPYSNIEDDAHPLAEKFISSDLVAEYAVKDFVKGDLKRYTIVSWLEGEDPQSSPEYTAPKGATIRLGVEITAYEN